MLNCLFREIHIQLDEGERWSGADCVSPEFKVFFDALDVLLTSVRGSLNYSLCISATCLDEAFLRLGTGCLNRALPKP
jgi:hypothetical protein